LQWTIPTAARASETLGATRSEIKSPSEFAPLAKLPNHLVDSETGVVPAERMKRSITFLFRPGPLPSSPAVNGKLFLGYERQVLGLLSTLRPLHSTWFSVELRDWAAEHDYPQELRMAQAHSAGDSTAPAYRHSTRLNKKRIGRMVNVCARKLLVRIALCVGSLFGIEFLDVGQG
jgi:hypothetical protein